MKNSHIEWCDHTFNAWEGCTKVSPGCANCYAEARDKRFTGGLHWGKGAPRRRMSAANWKQPVRWNRDAGLGRFRECAVCGKREFRRWDDTLPPGGLSCCSNPNCISLPESESSVVRPRIFCASLADWLDDEVPVEWLADLLDLIRRTPNLDWLLLTKRPELWRSRLMAVLDWLADGQNLQLAAFVSLWLSGGACPHNVWIGTTVEDQQRADERIPELLSIPARVRFLSCEPLLGPVDISAHRPRISETLDSPLLLPDWVICGGESGANARPMHPDWARGLRDQCQTAGVPFLFKQWGEHAPNWLNDNDGNKIEGSEWIDKMGKKMAGRLLDGVEHNEFPVLKK